ncbi:MAG: UDP-2,3-diacylglucosamine diphosphatase LpxI [Endomicrobiales bacterium]|nr:UDP-2,3-diacylglucosamine diphosphatase LpxI [Endomicrobiales bacterium]
MEKIGLIAGNGRFPFLVAEEIKKRGDSVAAVGIKEETDPDLQKHADTIAWFSLGQFQKLIDYLRDNGIKTAVMAGQVKHAQIFRNLNLDFRLIKLMGKIVNKKTDTILGAIAEELQKDGVTLLPSHIYLKHLMPDAGLLAGKKLSAAEKADVEFGFKTAKQIAGLDIGQTVVVKDKAVVAVESIEGTDECIRRAGKLAGENVIVVKVAKPAQDWRFDVPVVGPGTVEALLENKARALAVEAKNTLFIDKDILLEKARRNQVTIVAV